jgi:hypothetical protein
MWVHFDSTQQMLDVACTTLVTVLGVSELMLSAPRVRSRTKVVWLQLMTVHGRHFVYRVRSAQYSIDSAVLSFIPLSHSSIEEVVKKSGFFIIRIDDRN